MKCTHIKPKVVGKNASQAGYKEWIASNPAKFKIYEDEVQSTLDLGKYVTAAVLNKAAATVARFEDEAEKNILDSGEF